MRNQKKVIVTGFESCGKTQFIRRLLGYNFQENSKPTVGADFYTFMQKFKIWDTSGAERFKIATQLYHKESDILIYCVDASQVFNEDAHNNNLEEILSLYPEDSQPTVVLALTKVDIRLETAFDDSFTQFKRFRPNDTHIATSAKVDSEMLPFEELLVRLDMENTRTKLGEIVSKLSNNIVNAVERRTSGRNSFKVDELIKIYRKINDPNQPFDLLATCKEIQSICEIIRNPLHFWKTPNSVHEFATELDRSGLLEVVKESNNQMVV